MEAVENLESLESLRHVEAQVRAMALAQDLTRALEGFSISDALHNGWTVPPPGWTIRVGGSVCDVAFAIAFEMLPHEQEPTVVVTTPQWEEKTLNPAVRGNKELARASAWMPNVVANILQLIRQYVAPTTLLADHLKVLHEEFPWLKQLYLWRPNSWVLEGRNGDDSGLTYQLCIEFGGYSVDDVEDGVPGATMEAVEQGHLNYQSPAWFLWVMTSGVPGVRTQLGHDDSWNLDGMITLLYEHLGSFVDGRDDDLSEDEGFTMDNRGTIHYPREYTHEQLALRHCEDGDLMDEDEAQDSLIALDKWLNTVEQQQYRDRYEEHQDGDVTMTDV